MRRTILTVSLVVLALLAGCSVLDGDPERTATEFEPGADAPAWLDSDGDVNETMVAQRHLEAAASEGVKLRHRNGEDRRVVVRNRTRSLRWEDGTARWQRGNLTVSNESLDADFESRYDPVLSTSAQSSQIGIAIRLSSAQYEAVGTTTSDGTTLYELELTDTVGFGNAVGYYTGTALVDEAGRVHELSGRIGDNESAAEPYSYEYDWSVDAIPEPPWLDAIPRGESELRNDGRTFVVTVTGSAPIPTGTTLRVELAGSSGRESVELSQALEPGDSISFGLEDGTLVSSREPLNDSSLASLSDGLSTVEATVTLEDGRTVALQFLAGELV